MENNTIPEFDLELDDKIVIDLPLEDDDNIANDSKDTSEIDTGSEETSQTVEQSETAKIIFEQLVEENILSEDSEFDGSWEGLRKNVSELPQRILNSLVETRNDVSKDVLRYIFTSDNITKDEMLNFIKTNLEESVETELQLETMDDAREFLENVYKNKGLKPKAIEATLAALEEDESLLEEAREELEKQKLNAKPKTEKLIAEKEQQEYEEKQRRIEYTNSVISALEDTGWKKTKIDTIKQKIANNEINPTLVEIFRNPKALVKMVDFISYYKNGDIDYDKFINTIETPKAKDFKTRLETSISSPTTSSRSNLKNPEEELNNLKAII